MIHLGYLGYDARKGQAFVPNEEMPAGKGFAALLYLPLPTKPGDVPALVIELKWNKNATTALDQIRERNYTDPIADYTGDMILVGITYDKKTKKHRCVIETAEK